MHVGHLLHTGIKALADCSEIQTRACLSSPKLLLLTMRACELSLSGACMSTILSSNSHVDLSANVISCCMCSKQQRTAHTAHFPVKQRRQQQRKWWEGMIRRDASVVWGAASKNAM